MPKEDSRFLNVQKAALFLGVSPPTIRNWASSKKLKGVKVGLRGDWRFSKSQLKAIQTKPQKKKKYELSATERKLYKIFMEAPVPIAIVKGPDHVYELSNPLNNLALGIDNPVGKSVRDLMPHVKDLHRLLDRTYRTGRPFYAKEYPAEVKRGKATRTIYVNATYQPLRDTDNTIEGVLITGVDVTEQVLARKKVEESEKRFNDMFESVSDGFVSYDKDWKYVYLNKKALEMIGMKKEQLIGKSLFELFPDRVKTPIFQKYQEVMRKGTPENVEYFSPGANRWVRVNLYPSSNGMISFFTDITERKQIENNLMFLSQASKVLASSLDYEKTMANVAKLAVPQFADWIIIDLVQDKDTVNRVAVVHADSHLKRSARILQKNYPPDPRHHEGVPKVIRTGKSRFSPEVSEGLLRVASQNEKHYRLLKKLGFSSGICVALKSGGKVLGAITFIYGHSGRKYTPSDNVLAEEIGIRASLAIENAQLYSDAQNAIALRDEFISVASHELKTPLTSLKIYTQALQRKFWGKDVSIIQQTQKIDSQVNKLTDLISNLLNVARIQTGKLELEKNEFDLNILVKETIEAIQTTTRGHTILLRGYLRTPLNADRDRIEQVLTNLLTNAIKYSPAAGKIIVRVASRNTNALISVQDFGIGIDEKHQEKIFSRFYRVNSPSGMTFPGLGLGLYISNEIIQRHGGKMSVTSQKGKGSTFSFTLPLTSQKNK